MKKHAFPKQKKGILFGLILIILAASVPLMTDYVLNGINLQASLSRIEAVKQGFGRVFPVRIGPWGSLDYGYGAASFQADVFYLIPASLRLIGLKTGTAYKLSLFMANLATAVVAYLCFKKCFRRPEIGLIGSMLYTWCPYRLNEMYINADLGKVAAWIFLPLVLSGLVLLFTVDAENEDYGRSWVILTWGFSLLALSSTSIWFVTVGMTVLILIFMGKQTLRRQTLLALGKTAAATLSVNAWFLIPMLLRLRDVTNVGILIPRDIRSGGMYLPQYLSIFLWGGGSAELFENGMMEMQAMVPGIAVMSLVFLYMWASFTGKYQDAKAQRLFGRGMLCSCLVLIFLSSNSFPWDWFQDRNMLFSILLSFMNTPAIWGIPACAGLIVVACLMLKRMAVPENSWEYKAILPATVAVSFGVTQFLLGNILKTRPYVRLDEAYEMLPLQVIASESFVWRLCEVISVIALCGCLALSVLRRRKNAEKV